MLMWIFIFLGISLVSGLLGFTNISIASKGIAKVLFYIFLFALLVSVVVFLL